MNKRFREKIKNTFFDYWLAFAQKRRIAMFALAVMPITSIGAGMTLYVDNTSLQKNDTVVMNDYVIALDERIIVTFEQSVVDTKAYERHISCFPAEQLSFDWRDNNRVVHVIPQSIWRPGTQYSIAFPQYIGAKDEDIAQIFQFETAAYPQVISTSTEDPRRAFQAGEEILVTFDQDIAQYDLQAVVRPYISTEQFIDIGGRNMRIRISDDINNDSDDYYNITIFAKYNGQTGQSFYPVGSVGFNTLLPTPQEWPKEFVERIEMAKRSTAPKIKEGKYIDVNLAAQVTTLFEDGMFVASFIDSPGAKDTPTPTGTFQIYNKNPYALSGMFGVYLPFWMAFTEDGKYGFHDLIVWPEGHKDMPQGGKESERSLGNAVSPGCVRHDAKNSTFIYNWSDVGTPVVIY